MFFLFERPHQLDFENYQVIWCFVKNIQILGFAIDGGQKWLYTSGCDLSPNFLLKDIWHWEKINIIKLVFSILQCMRKYIWTNIVWCPRKERIFSSIETLSLVEKG
jgi:hypothetical protein